MVPAKNVEEFLRAVDAFLAVPDDKPLDVDKVIQFLVVNQKYLATGLSPMTRMESSTHAFHLDSGEKLEKLYERVSKVRSDDPVLQKLHRLSEVLRPLGKMKGDVLAHAMAHLETEEIGRAAQVSKEWANTSKQAKVWWINAHPLIPLMDLGINTPERLLEFCSKNRELTFLNLEGF